MNRSSSVRTRTDRRLAKDSMRFDLRSVGWRRIQRSLSSRVVRRYCCSQPTSRSMFEASSTLGQRLCLMMLMYRYTRRPNSVPNSVNNGSGECDAGVCSYIRSQDFESEARGHRLPCNQITVFTFHKPATTQQRSTRLHFGPQSHLEAPLGIVLVSSKATRVRFVTSHCA